MKKWIIMFLGLNFAFVSFESHAQFSKMGKTQLKYLQLLNDSLGSTAERMLDELNPAERLRADSLFTRMLVRGMVVPFSFYFPFDSLLTAPVLYPEDSTFRIITWHYSLNDADYRQKGVLQLNTVDGSPKFFPLFDVSEYTEAPQDSVRDNRNWIGAIYYKIVTTTRQHEKIYALFGYDENNSITTRKWIEPLTFNKNGEPVFGGDYFRIPYSSTYTESSRRYLMEYKTGSRARLNFDDEEGMVIMDHLISESNEPERRYTLVPGGDYSGLKWEKDAWVLIPRLNVEMRGEGNEPRPSLILQDDGTANEDVLQKQSDKNMKQPKPATNTENATTKPKKKN